jgi:hypothetical protein
VPLPKLRDFFAAFQSVAVAIFCGAIIAKIALFTSV